MKKHLFLIAVISVITLCGIGIVYLIYLDENTIDTQVELKDGTSYTATSTHSYNNGLTEINFINDSRIIVPTNSIKVIKSIKTN
jgi:hypothetical protein